MFKSFAAHYFTRQPQLALGPSSCPSHCLCYQQRPHFIDNIDSHSISKYTKPFPLPVTTVPDALEGLPHEDSQWQPSQNSSHNCLICDSGQDIKLSLRVKQEEKL